MVIWHNKCDVHSASALCSAPDHISGFYITWWAHNSMLMNYDPSDLRVVLEHLKEKTNSESQIFQTVLLCDPSVLRSRHLKHSRTCARHWERCRLLVLVALLPVSWFHRSLFLHMFDSSRPSRPSLCRHPVTALHCIWTWNTFGWDTL